MTLKFMESFDGVSTFSELVNGLPSDTVDSTHGKWMTASPLARFSLDASGRTGQCLKHDATTGPGQPRTQQLGLGTECYVGVGFKPGFLATMTNDLIPFFGLFDEDGNICLQLFKNKNGSITAGHGGGLGTVTSAAGVLTTAAFQMVEVHFKLADAGGAIDVRVDGVDVATLSGDTKAATATSIERIWVSAATGFSTNDIANDAWDDIYACDTAGGGPDNTWLGDFKARVIRPNGNGNSSVLVGSDADSTDNYLLVDEQVVNDADYVQSTADGDKDTYAFTDPTITGAVVGVQVVARSRYLNGTDPKSFNAVQRLSGTETEAALNALNATLRERYVIFTTKPGGGAWTQADLANAEFGVKQIDA